MTYIALTGFVGLASVRKGEIIVIKDNAVARDLLNAGYIEPIDKTATILDDNKQYREIG